MRALLLALLACACSAPVPDSSEVTGSGGYPLGCLGWPSPMPPECVKLTTIPNPMGQVDCGLGFANYSSAYQFAAVHFASSPTPQVVSNGPFLACAFNRGAPGSQLNFTTSCLNGGVSFSQKIVVNVGVFPATHFGILQFTNLNTDCVNTFTLVAQR